MWCRRRRESALVLVVRVGKASRRSIDAALTQFRATDNVVATKAGKGFEIRAIVDDDPLARNGIERRVAEALGDVPAQFGWARFPDGGLTLEVLFEQARPTGLTGAAQQDRAACTGRSADGRLAVPLGGADA
jgi:hypothetical protein